MKKVEFDEQCKQCGGTGLYKGMGERDGYAVVCHHCDGTGKYHFVHEYDEFAGRKDREDVKTVLQCNPGICAGGNLDFGGMSYSQWKESGIFPPKSEMRGYTCPAWWYQVADYELKPDWDECQKWGTFSSCKHFQSKCACWEKWDRENAR